MITQSLCNGADKTRGVQIHMQAFIFRHGQKHRQGQQLANRYIEGKADEYSGVVFDRRTVSRGLDKRGNPGTSQEIRNQTTRQHEKTRLN